MRTKLKALAAAGAAAAALGGLAAAPASADVRYTLGSCVAYQSQDGHRLYNITCGKSAAGTRFVVSFLVCNTSSCRTVVLGPYQQGTVHSYTTGGYISNFRVAVE